MRLTIYTDDSLTEVSRVAEADKLKIPYKVSMMVIQSLDTVNLNNNDDVVAYLSKNINQLDKVIRATFGLTESELECIDTSELVETGKEIYKWAIEKVNSIKGGEKNARMTV